MPKEYNCTVHLALERMLRYNAIGLTEEFELTLQVFEHRLPMWFAHASKMYARKVDKYDHQTSFTNNLTNFSMAGALSNQAVAILRRMPFMRDELEFYKQAVRRFWRDAAAAGLLGS